VNIPWAPQKQNDAGGPNREEGLTPPAAFAVCPLMVPPGMLDFESGFPACERSVQCTTDQQQHYC
jgi:hypothetical protein